MQYDPSNPLIVQGDRTILVEVDNERYAQARDAVGAAGLDDVADGVAIEIVRAETAAVAAVDLQVEQRRGDPAGDKVR